MSGILVNDPIFRFSSGPYAMPLLWGRGEGLTQGGIAVMPCTEMPTQWKLAFPSITSLHLLAST